MNFIVNHLNNLRPPPPLPPPPPGINLIALYSNDLATSLRHIQRLEAPEAPQRHWYIPEAYAMSGAARGHTKMPGTYYARFTLSWRLSVRCERDEVRTDIVTHTLVQELRDKDECSLNNEVRHSCNLNWV